MALAKYAEEIQEMIWEREAMREQETEHHSAKREKNDSEHIIKGRTGGQALLGTTTKLRLN